jgi:L-seryl-tRNA(Ser) seleniumtransferase
VLDPRRAIPSVDRLLAGAAFDAIVGLYGRGSVRVQVGHELAELRRRLPAAGGAGALAAELAKLPVRVAAALAERHGRPLSRVLNTTGIFLHTNLGRAPLPRGLAAEVADLLEAGCDLEMDLASGQRGERNTRLRPLLTSLTTAEDGLIVNNAAAALVLALATLAAGREVIVARGELVEIGGSFRIPDILATAGARLVEVGTTNRVRLADYEAAIGPETSLLLKVFPSNYRITGFVATVAAEELVALGARSGLPVLVDEGSGLLTPSEHPELGGHPSIRELLAAGVDLVASSGDKLLGGPQAGLLLGRGRWLERCRRQPLARALRPGRVTFVLLERILLRHLAALPLPIERLWPEPEAHRRRLEALRAALDPQLAARARITPAEAFVGGGAAPERPIRGEALALPGDETQLARLRSGDPPVVAYTREGRVLVDLRTVDPEDDGLLAAALDHAWSGLADEDPGG